MKENSKKAIQESLYFIIDFLKKHVHFSWLLILIWKTVCAKIISSGEACNSFSLIMIKKQICKIINNIFILFFFAFLSWTLFVDRCFPSNSLGCGSISVFVILKMSWFLMDGELVLSMGRTNYMASSTHVRSSFTCSIKSTTTGFGKYNMKIQLLIRAKTKTVLFLSKLM